MISANNWFGYSIQEIEDDLITAEECLYISPHALYPDFKLLACYLSSINQHPSFIIETH